MDFVSSLPPVILSYFGFPCKNFVSIIFALVSLLYSRISTSFYTSTSIHPSFSLRFPNRWYEYWVSIKSRLLISWSKDVSFWYWKVKVQYQFFLFHPFSKFWPKWEIIRYKCGPKLFCPSYFVVMACVIGLVHDCMWFCCDWPKGNGINPFA